jgi:hypothetical protein
MNFPLLPITGMEVRQLLTAREVAHMLRLSCPAIDKRLRNRGLDELRRGAQWRFSQEAISIWVANAAALQKTKE